MGLVWLLRGRPVVALTESTAAIQTQNTGNVLTFRKANKPALDRRIMSMNEPRRRTLPSRCPASVGDSLDDFTA
jgi:hypothetical protein